MGFEERLIEHQRSLIEDNVGEWRGVLADSILRHIDNGENNQDLRDLAINLDVMPQDKEELLSWLSNKYVKRRKLTKLLSTCYYKEEWDGRPDVMLLMETPGSLSYREDSRHREAERLLDEDSIEEQVKLYRKFSHGWLGNNLRNNFTAPFLRKLSESSAVDIKVESLEDYIPDSLDDMDGGESLFFKDFYVTDVVSFRIKGGSINSERRNRGMEIVVEEISYIEPDVVFCFGTKPWRAIRKNAEVKALTDGYEVESGITSVHGGLYKVDFESEMDFEPGLIEELEASSVKVIPLAHMSRAKNYIRGSYTHYMKNGLNDLRTLL